MCSCGRQQCVRHPGARPDVPDFLVERDQEQRLHLRRVGAAPFLDVGRARVCRRRHGRVVGAGGGVACRAGGDATPLESHELLHNEAGVAEPEPHQCTTQLYHLAVNTYAHSLRSPEDVDLLSSDDGAHDMSDRQPTKFQHYNGCSLGTTLISRTSANISSSTYKCRRLSRIAVSSQGRFVGFYLDVFCLGMAGYFQLHAQ